jgi:uncharacterized protein (DUF885 family)
MTTDIYALCHDFVDELAEEMPTLATYFGIRGHDHRWNDYSPEGYQSVAELIRGQLARIDSLEEPTDEWAGLAVRVAREELERHIADYEADEHLLDLNSIASTVQDLRDTFDQMDADSAQGWADIASRLEGLPEAAAGYIRSLDAGRAKGLTVARRQVVEAARQARNFAGDDSHFLTYPAALAASGEGDDALASRLEAAIDIARGGFTMIADYLEQEYAPDAVESDAVGPERYRRLARRYLGSDLDPEATYEWGWSEVERLRARMAEVAEQIVPGGTLGEALELLLTDPDRAAASQEEFVELMQERQEIALRELEGVHFDVPEPIRTIQVRMTPPGGSLGAYYYSPSEDFVRPGTVFWSKGDQQQIPLFDEVSTAYHEGFPGHHLQVGLQLTAGDRFSRLHKLMVWYSGSGEGWALYAEDLMEELGYLEKPDFVMGKLASEMLRACRVVIDIGSHLELPIASGQPFHPGEAWNFDLGVEMLDTYAAQDHAISVSEMNRYLGWPGQAISYKVGQREIRALRAEQKARLGADYDEKAFHARLLEVGAVGLDIVRDHMRTG